MNVRRLASLTTAEREAYFDREGGLADIDADVSSIVERVRADGDDAIRRFSREFDDVRIDDIEVTDRLEGAIDAVDPEIADAIRTAAANIRAFHERQRPDDWRETVDGRELGRRFRPIETAGVYVPGGTATYPSSGLMGVIPAVVAGVEEVAVTTPPAANLPPATLAALEVAGADRLYQVGGAHGIAALAYGTETVDPVRKIVGPGNRWVTAAKAAVRGDVAIDFLAGPSEILVVADATADPGSVAADLLAQAEHDPDASAVAVTDDADTAEAIVSALERRLDRCTRADVIEAALSNEKSGVLLAESLADATEFAEAYAAEHLSIQTADEEAVLAEIDSAGSVFLGGYTPVAAGDYASGTNHVLPTGGGAKVTGGLSVDTFLRASTVQRLDREALEDLSETITALATAEGLDAHARSIEQRFEGE